MVGRVRAGIGVELWPLLGVAVEQMRAVVVSVRVDDGIAVDGRAQLHHEAVAKATVEALHAAQAAAAQTAGPRFAPLIERLGVAADGAAIVIHGEAAGDELARLLPSD